MDIENVEKKIREARFFLDKMREQEGRAFGDKEPFDFYLSAFLSAAKAVGDRFNRMQQPACIKWREKWPEALAPSNRALVHFFNKQRDIEVHAGGSVRAEKAVKIAAGGGYSDDSGMLYVTDPFGADVGAVIYKPAYYFTIEKVEREATQACSEYCELLKQRLAAVCCRQPVNTAAPANKKGPATFGGGANGREQPQGCGGRSRPAGSGKTRAR